ncbi:MAG: hypothetical protein WCV90_00690 [Candidatus Woesearchaeota archaeon]|jgi:hypothetical protein
MDVEYFVEAQDFAAKHLSGNGWELGLPLTVYAPLFELLFWNGFEKDKTSPKRYLYRARQGRNVVKGYDLLLEQDLSKNPTASIFRSDAPEHFYSLVSVDGEDGKSRFDSDLEKLLKSATSFTNSTNKVIEYSNIPAVVVGGVGTGMATFLSVYHFILSKGMGADIPHLKDVLVPLWLLVAVAAGVGGGAQYAKLHRKHLNEVHETAEREFNQNWEKFNEDYLATRTVYDQRALKAALGVN